MALVISLCLLGLLILGVVSEEVVGYVLDGVLGLVLLLGQ